MLLASSTMRSTSTTEEREALRVPMSGAADAGFLVGWMYAMKHSNRCVKTCARVFQIGPCVVGVYVSQDINIKLTYTLCRLDDSNSPLLAATTEGEGLSLRCD